MKRIFPGLFFFLFAQIIVFAQADKTAYIEKYKTVAVKKMLEHHIPASITLAQGILESGSGKSTLAKEANNHFGIKCHIEWNGPTYTMDDDTKNECFRKYQNQEESYEDHSFFLTSRPRYAFLFEYEITDYKNWAYGLKKAGYATNPEYANLLIKVIEENDLQRFDHLKSVKDTELKEPQLAHAPEHPETPDYMPSNFEDFHPISLSMSNRIIYETNGVNYVLALRLDSWQSIAEEFGFYTKQILTFNSATLKTTLHEGDRVYIQNKNTQASVMYHIVLQGETLQSIGQTYAVRTSSIRKMNKIKKNEDLIAGQRLKLK